MTIAAIQTTYAGCRFRSRLEARWAVFFDELGIAWTYEPQGYEVGYDATRPYLPDFYLPDLELWVEVKGDDSNIDWTLIGDACDGFGPHLPDCERWCYGGGNPGAAVLILGNIPPDNTRWFHILGRNQKGVWFEFVEWANPRNTGWSVETRRSQLFEYESFWGVDPSTFNTDVRRRLKVHGRQAEGVMASTYLKTEYANIMDVRLGWAYSAARQARFEHGESGA